MMAVGIIAILLISGYLIFSFNEKSNLDQLNASLDNDVMNESIDIKKRTKTNSRKSKNNAAAIIQVKCFIPHF